MRLGPSQKAAGKEGQTEFPTFPRFHLSPKKIGFKTGFWIEIKKGAFESSSSTTSSFCRLAAAKKFSSDFADFYFIQIVGCSGSDLFFLTSIVFTFLFVKLFWIQLTIDSIQRCLEKKKRICFLRLANKLSQVKWVM